MQTNVLPQTDTSINTTGCCPKFNPEGWSDVVLHFEAKPFARAHTASAMHVPLNMGRVFSRMQRHIDAAGAVDPAQFIVLSRDLSAWSGEHLFAVTKPVPDEEMTTLSGDFLTHVFEGPYAEARNWYTQMQDLARAKGHDPKEVYFYYTTCPKCAKAYGQNYVVGLVAI